MAYILFYLSVILAMESTIAEPCRKILNDGSLIPPISLGTVGPLSKKADIKPAVITAIEKGYRQIDTAAFYQNEDVIGEAIIDVIDRGIVTRNDLWITSKLDINVLGRDGVVPATKEALKRLQLDYIDLYLIHLPISPFNPAFDYLSIWKGLEDAKNLNLVKSIGVSNFNTTQLNKLLLESSTVPSVNEIEVNPTFTNLGLAAYCQSLNITVLAYAPFGYLVPRPYRQVVPPPPTFDDPILVNIANKYNKSTSQIVLRYSIDRGLIPLPKSTNPDHINSNFEIFDFNLTEDEIYQINDFEKNMKVYDFDYLNEWYSYFT